MGPMAPVTTSPLSERFEYGIIPRPPVEPTIATRPASWPTNPPAADPRPHPPTSPRASTRFGAAPCQIESNWEFCEGTQILAQVGSEAIFAYEIMGDINEVLEKNKDRIPKAQWEMVRTQLIRKHLKLKIETKLVFLDAQHSVPAEGIKQFEKKINDYFDQTRVPKMLESAGVTTTAELDAKFRTYGSSLDRVRRAFFEGTLAQEWARQKIKEDEEVTYDQMLQYYHEHAEEFEKPARARWEEIVVRYSKYPSKPAAHDALAALGNQVLSGVPFAEVAKAGSDGTTAAEGGRRDWVSQGSLVDEELNRAIFGLPVGQLSPILEGDHGYYIIRVIERSEKQITPFLTAQVEIQEKIKQRRIAQQQKDYLAELERKTPVWTIFDGPEGIPQISERSPAPRR
jgi:parvulin-like peptidyl-prolyl isomerase